MRSSVVLAAAVASVVPAALGLTISTPAQLVQCQPVGLSWSEGTAPFYVSVYPGGQTSGALLQFQQFQDTSYTWTVNVTAGTSVTLGVLDSTGTNAYTSPLDIQSGTSEDCLTSGGGDSSSSATDSSTPSSTTDATSASESASESSSASESASSSEESSSSAASSSATESGASTTRSSSGSSSESPSSSGSAPGSEETGEDGGDGAFRSAPAMGLAALLAVVGAALF